MFDGCKLSRVEDAKFLGITIDEILTWKKQIDNVCKLCARNILPLYHLCLNCYDAIM